MGVYPSYLTFYRTQFDEIVIRASYPKFVFVSEDSQCNKLYHDDVWVFMATGLIHKLVVVNSSEKSADEVLKRINSAMFKFRCDPSVYRYSKQALSLMYNQIRDNADQLDRFYVNKNEPD